MQVGNFDEDHSACYRAQLDTFTTRKTWFIDNSKPGSDLLYMASAALSAYSEARTGDLATRAAAKAQVLFAEGKAQEGTMYSSSIPEMGASYRSESAEQYGFLAAAWLFRTTKDAKWRTVRSCLFISFLSCSCTFWKCVFAAQGFRVGRKGPRLRWAVELQLLFGHTLVNSQCCPQSVSP